MKTLTVHQIKRFNVREGEPDYQYKVVQVTDSITPNVGEFIDAYELQDVYCDSEHWKVTIK